MTTENNHEVMSKKDEIIGFISLLLSLIVLGLILFNTVRSFERGIEQKIQVVQNDVNEVNIKVAGIEAKLDVLIAAWNLEMPESPSVASTQ